VDVHILDARTFAPYAVMRGVRGDADFCLSKLVFDNSGLYVVSPNYTMSFDYLP
jgi:hypothetical protein